MAALHALVAIFFAFGLVQVANAYGTEEPASQGRLQCYDDDFDIIRCEYGCRTTQQWWEGEWLPAERGCREQWTPDKLPVKARFFLFENA